MPVYPAQVVKPLIARALTIALFDLVSDFLEHVDGRLRGPGEGAQGRDENQRSDQGIFDRRTSALIAQEC